MDQLKIGKFISQMRKEKGLTQKQLGEELLISDKTVSKWETVKGMPEVSLMLPLCEKLGINVNELLTGERIPEEDYKKKAEENIMNIMREKEESVKKVIIEAVAFVITVLACVVIIAIAGLTDIKAWQRILLVIVAIIIMAGGITVGAMADMSIGTFECKHCGTRFVPSAKEYIFGVHTITTRKLTCPKCGKRSYCKHRLTH
ncbi:helix-turn-helix domain-containing protein [Ruminococcus flavefaciens]|uniref:helix-turn-helix domain-containing protein n=1 Tax=Ruminococcus flavefaciens TaxID=1265 RepID=UPI0026ECDE26|nr:helix-turn-helix transcriptional regulator [Ruminococcus flavefaciens]MDD7517639.1 helix-turn-helix transcriptional regulator [Ruminococcus flavefaciens]MDY5691329.1 helix-turn-helix transcriptional regulator [Ruminococcus flavefaciens]